MERRSTDAESTFARARRFVAARLDPHSHLGLGLTVRLAIVVGAVWALSGLLDAVLDNATLVRLDLAIAHWFHFHTTPRGLTAFDVITQLGSPVANALIGIVAIYLLLRRERALFWTWLAANLGGKVIEYVLKNAVHRSRPEYAAAYLHGRSYSFPSGHTLTATICYLFIAYIVATRPNITMTVRRVVFAIAAFVVFLVAFSRIYLGVHYPSDVAGGFAAGLGWLSLCGVTRKVVTGMSS